MAYNELIKNFEKVRAYMREFYVYGFKSRTEYDAKSARSYDDERRRLESWLGDYMRFTQTPEGKNVFLSVDSRVTRKNPFYKAWKAKSFTDGDITLHFAIFDILYDPETKMTLTELIEEIDQRLSSSMVFDESTLRKKLKEYAEEGIIRMEKDGRKVLYSRAPDTDITALHDVIDFFSEVAPCGVIGSFLQDRQPKHPELFSFKHHYITQAMDSDVMATLFEAIRGHRYITVDNLGKHSNEVRTVRLVPLKLYISAQNGRQNLLAFHEKANRLNASNAETVRKAKRIARYLGMSDAEYRKTLVELRKKIRIIENHLREKDYSFDYAKQPSKAMFKYRKAFLRNDGERYHAFLEAVSSGEKQLHADNLAPYEIVRSALNANRWGFHADLTVGEKAALNASWASLPDFCDNRNALAVVDTSGSMYCYDNALPAAVALSLGLYFGERNTGIFHNHFIEFSSRPQLIEIKGKTFAERLEYLCTFNEVADTNVEAVFDLILDAAVRNNVPQEELPETLYLISDMEFNACVRNASVSNFTSAKRRFAEHGYRLPQIVFWNVASRNSNQPVTKNEQGVALVSGCTPRLFSMVTSGDLSPYSVMMDIIESERYAKISA